MTDEIIKLNPPIPKWWCKEVENYKDQAVKKRDEDLIALLEKELKEEEFIHIQSLLNQLRGKNEVE